MPVVGCRAPHPNAAPPDSAAQPAARGGTPALTLAVYNVYRGEADPRWETLPATLHIVELPPQVTVRLASDPPAGSLRVELDGRSRVDSSAPFFLSEGVNGEAVDWGLAPGRHRLAITAYTGPDGSGRVLARAERSFELLADGLDPSPATGEHARFPFWLTSDGRYVTRSAQGDFVDLDGQVALASDEVALEQTEDEQGHLVTVRDDAPRLELAFLLLVPDGYQPGVRYPLVVFLHHGWSVFRGTDNDGRVLAESPPFDGEHSLTRGPERTRYPAIFLVPQMIRKETRDGVEHEWAAFTALDEEAGTVKGAPQPSVSGAFTMRVLGDLLSGALPVAGAPLGVDTARVYLTGHSMGGLGTWDLLARWPERWAAAVPMAGYPDPATAERVTGVPIWAFHHVADCYNAANGTRAMHRLVSAAGGTMRLTELTFDTGGQCDQAHFRTPDAAWSLPELPLWLFSQVRAGPR